MPKLSGAYIAAAATIDRRQTDERVEGGDKLRHRRHGDAPGDDRAGTAADGKAEHDQQEAAEASGLASSSVVTMAMPMPTMP